jgi:protein phosphatase
LKRQQNEDRFAISAFWVDSARSLPALFAILSDGIGGHQAGEIAAEMAVELTSQAIASSDAARPTEILRQALTQTSQAILEKAGSDPVLNGMGATCACCWVIGAQLYIAYLGDSRIYLLRGKAIQQISKDHTWVQEAIESGVLTPEQARSHPNMHVIRRFLGSPRAMQPDTRLYLQPGENNAQAEANQGLRLAPGDQLLMCSDGLSDLVESSEILQTLSSQNLEKAVDTLIALSNQRGGHDNITLVALQMPGTAARAAPGAPSRLNSPLHDWRKRRVWFALGILGVLLLCGLLTLAVWFFLANQLF